MESQKLFESKKFFIFNMILVAMILGFALGIFVLSNWGAKPVPAFAESKSLTVSPTLMDLQNSFRSISKAVMPSVVLIKTVETRQATQMDQPFEDFPWDWFFKGPQQDEKKPGTPQNPKTQPKVDPRNKARGLGSGIMIERKGNTVYLVTNNHVAGTAEEITIVLNDEREFKGKLVGTDARKDVAVVSFETTEQNITLARLGDSSEIEVGDWVLAMGNPLGLEFSLSSGIVSAINRHGGPENNINDFIQTDAAINRGNSGGALVNLKGEVIGINTWIASPTGASVGLGFAIPINNVKRAISEFISKGAVQYGWLGASISDVTKDTAVSLGLPDTKGALVAHLFKDSPAEKGGIQVGDFVQSLNGKTIRNRDEFVYQVGDLAPGAKADFDVIRGGEKKKVSVTIAARGSEKDIEALSTKMWPGFAVVPITQEVIQELNLKPDAAGLIIINVLPRTPAQIGGLKEGDIVSKINGQAVKSMKDFYKELNNVRSGEVKVTYSREGVEFSITFSR